MKIVVECAKMAFQIKTQNKEQCLEGVTVRHAYWRTRVCHVCIFQDLIGLKTDRDLKKIIPLYTFGALANAYTEDTFYEADKST
jgi:hypothetical protein